ncbi:hypothetical protein JCM8547_004480 [Rhodosporidiobolus lusitaniae]
MSAFTPASYSRPSSSQAPPTTSLSSAFAPSSSTSSAAPSQEYAQLCKVVLARRNRNLLSLTAAASAAALYVGIFDPRGLPGSFFNIVPLLLFSPLAFLGSLPVIVLRKQTVTTARPPSPTRFSELTKLYSRSSLHTFLAYLLSAAFLHVAYVWAAGWASREAKLEVFFFHEGRDAWQVNERRVLLGIFHAFLAVFATVQHVAEDRSVVHFDDDVTLTIPARLSAKASKRVAAAFGYTSTAILTFWTSYVILRRPILRFVLIHIAGNWARPHLWSAMRYNGAYSVTLAARAVSSAVLHFLVWEAAHVCFEVYATQPMTVSQFSPSPNQALISGLHSCDPYYQQFAYLELSLLTLTDASRRQAIFKDVKPGSATGGAWSEISRECLLLVGTELQRAKGRGALPRPSSSTGSSYASSSQQQQPSPNRAPVKSGDVFLATKPSLFDKLASAAVSSGPSSLGSSPIVQTVTKSSAAAKAEQAVSSALSSASSAVSRVPSILQTASLSPVPSLPSASEEKAAPPPAIAPSEVAQVVGFEDKVAKFVPASWRNTLFAVRMESRAGRCVPKRRETICAVQALSNLICASLTEDPYGVAQRDIPKILEAFVRYLSVLDGLADELEMLAEKTTGGKEEKEKARRVVEKEVGEVQEALRSGAKAILTEFAQYIGEFRFPSSIAAQLQLLVDYA